VTHPFLDRAASAELDTPVVVVDLDRVDERIATMAVAMRERGVALRPHAKTHKSLELARRQLAAAWPPRRAPCHRAAPLCTG